MPAQLFDSMAEVVKIKLPFCKIVLPQLTLQKHFENNRVSFEFYDLYIKDKPEPLETLALIISTH